MASTQATNKKGAPTQQSANAFASQMKASRVAPHTWQGLRKPTPNEIAQAGGDATQAFRSINSTQYPQRPLPLDDRDSDVAMMRDLVEGSGGAPNQVGYVPPLITPARPLPVQDWELQYMKDKAAAEDYAAYQQWLSNKYDLNDMATRAWFKQIAPEYFTQKRELLKELMDRHAKYSYLRMAGPENEEDLLFEYAVETGRIPIPKGPFYNPLEWLNAETSHLKTPQGVIAGSADDILNKVSEINKEAYQYGLFNPVKPRTPSQGSNVGSLLNPMDIAGSYAERTYGFMGQDVPQNYNWATQYNGQNLTGGRLQATFDGINKKRILNSEKGGAAETTSADGTFARPLNVYSSDDRKYYKTPTQYRPPNTRLWNF